MRQTILRPLLIAVVTIISACTHHSVNRNVIDHPGSIEVQHVGYLPENPAQYKAIVNGKEFIAEGTAYIPSAQSAILLENTMIKPGDVVLDIGTGAGIQAIFAAQNAKKVVATDIDPSAVKSTTINVNLHGLNDKIDIRLGDLFEPLKQGELFDVVICNIDYPYDLTAEKKWQVHERFFAGIGKFLKHDGTIFYQSGWIWNIPRVMAMIDSNGFAVKRLLMLAADKQSREPIVFSIKHGIKKNTRHLFKQQTKKKAKENNGKN